jgi:hypothetical protein
LDATLALSRLGDQTSSTDYRDSTNTQRVSANCKIDLEQASAITSKMIGPESLASGESVLTVCCLFFDGAGST